jgi:hypothetical protein
MRLGPTTFAVALAVRLAWLWSVHDLVFFDHLQTEPARYAGWAAAIVDGSAGLRPPFDEAPGYPLLLAAIQVALGPGPAWVAGVQAVLDALTCALVASVAARIAGPRAGWVAGLLGAVCGPLVYFTGQLEPATLAAFAVALGLAATPTEAVDRGWARAGVAWALGMLVRSELIGTWPFAVVHAARVGGRTAAIRLATPPIALLAAVLVVNSGSAGTLVGPTTGAGVNLWIGDGAGSDGVDPFLVGPRADAAEAVDRASRDAVEADRRFAAMALHDAAADPGHLAEVLARKVRWALAAKELPNAADIGWQTGQVPWAWVLPGLGLVLPLAAAGVAARPRAGWLLAGPLAVGIAVQVVFLANARFRLPLVPALLVLAGLAVERALADRGSWRRLGLGAAVGAALAWVVPWGAWSYRIPALDLNTAALELIAGDHDAGFARMRAAVAARPEDPLAWAQLARSLELLGRVDEARQVWVDAEAALPDDRRIAGGRAAFERRHR